MSQTATNPPKNDPSISDSENLLRRIDPEHHIVPDGKGGVRLSSAAFSNTTGTNEMSVHISSKLASQTDTLKSFPDFYLISFTALTARKLSQGVIPDPLPRDLSHGEVCGDKPKKIQRQFIQNSTWIISPPSHGNFKAKLMHFLKRLPSYFRV